MSSASQLTLRIAVPSPLRQLFDYLPPAGHEGDFIPGIRVLVPFGRRQLVGILIECSNESSIDPSRLKPVLKLLDRTPLLTAALFESLRWAASYYQHPIGEVFHTALPNRLRADRAADKQEEVWTANAGASDELVAALGKAKKQKALFELLQDSQALSIEEITAAGFSRSLLRQLQQKELIEQHQRPLAVGSSFDACSVDAGAGPPLNQEQQHAVDAIGARLDEFACFLLDGVTGSGKTEVYMLSMGRQLRKGKQCLVLVPEIGLTPQTIGRFQQRFDCPVVALHSGLTNNERLDAWNRARQGGAGIVIGTRSAIFTPLARPGLIVVDEEHDASFKQQDGFRYSARDLALVRAREENIPVVLGSATPSLESLHNARSGKFDYLRLSKRAGSAQSSTMEVIDIGETHLETGFSEQLLFRIQQHLADKGQVLVFLNRRGFAPVLSCQDCGWFAECANCIAQLTVHAQPASLRCHHCGTVRQLPISCESCRSQNLSTLGIGTQQIEKFLESRFADSPVLRIDRDSTRSKRRFEDMLQQIQKGEPCILLGTQMLAKGHHLPDITLVAILDADVGLFSADFRGQEHMAQTILQVAGRSGRAERPGEVLIQSRHAGHATVQSLLRGSYSEIADVLLGERQETAMPPYSHLALMRAEAKQLEPAMSFLRQVDGLLDELGRELGIKLDRIGPLPAPMEKRAGRYRLQILMKHESRPALQEFLKHLCPRVDELKQPGGLRWSLDVDPQDLI